MYSSSYKARSGAVKAFEDAYAKEAFLKRSTAHGNVKGCTPFSETRSDGYEEPREKELVCSDKRTLSEPCKPKKENSGLLSGLDSGDILLILLMLFFLTDKDSENDGMIPVLLALILLF